MLRLTLACANPKGQGGLTPGAAARPGLWDEALKLHRPRDSQTKKPPQLQPLTKAATLHTSGPRASRHRVHDGPAREAAACLPSTVKHRRTSFWLLTTRGLDDSTGTQICSKGQETTVMGGRCCLPRAPLAQTE